MVYIGGRSGRVKLFVGNRGSGQDTTPDLPLGQGGYGPHLAKLSFYSKTF